MVLLITLPVVLTLVSSRLLFWLAATADHPLAFCIVLTWSEILTEVLHAISMSFADIFKETLLWCFSDIRSDQTGTTGPGLLKVADTLRRQTGAGATVY
jgi:hypothetical protein